MKATLRRIDYDLDAAIAQLGQVVRTERRDRGEAFTRDEHIRGLILSMLSNQRPWGPIIDNMDRLTDVFYGFDLERIKRADKSMLARKVKELKCGNRAIDKQMASLDDNIRILEQIEAAYGSLEHYVTSDVPERIASELGRGRTYKLKQIGYTLALEYLRNVGIQAIKPDVHIRRIISQERLRLHSGHPTEAEAVDVMRALAMEAGVSLTYLDNLMWLYCAVDYAHICGSDPKCDRCELRPDCRLGLEGQAI